MITSHYLEYCESNKQTQILEAVLEKGSNRKAAKKLGCSSTAVDQCIKRIKKPKRKLWQAR